MAAGWDEQELQLERRAGQVRSRLGIEADLGRVGQVTLVGSAALRVMDARDIDLTVTVPRLDSSVLQVVCGLAAQLGTNSDVRTVTLRNDTGRWNVDPDYPDGIYLFVECADDIGELWTFDIWFVDEPELQPDLRHLERIGKRITPESQAIILAIKRATHGRRSDGSRLPSIEIYEAVLDGGIRTPEEFADRAH